MADVISPVAIGVISDPPTIVVSYDCVGKDKRKRRKRKMPLRDFTDRSNVKRYAFNLRQRHNKYLANIIDVTLEKMLRIIQEIQKGSSVAISLEVVNKEYSIDPDEDLNKLSPAQLAQRKAVMDEMFHKNLVKPGDPDFVYDREVQFDLRNEKSDGNDWDDESEKIIKSKIEKAQVIKDGNETTLLPIENICISTTEAPVNLVSPLESSVVENSNDKDVEIDLPKDEVSADTVKGSSAFNDMASPAVEDWKSVEEFQVKPLPTSVHNELLIPSKESKTAQKANDDSSSTHDIEEALVEIECGDLEEEDEEDFWK